MKHPLLALDAPRFRRVYWALFAATILASAVLQHFGGLYAQKTDASGQAYDVIAFEFAGTPERVEIMKTVWGEEGIAAARTQTLLDYVYLLLYSTLIAGGVLALASQMPHGSFWARTGAALAWGQWAAAALDAVENAGLLISLGSAAHAPWPQVSWFCAALKFALVGAGFLYILVFVPCAYRPRAQEPSTP
ncbi:MAG: hypothetical protein HYV27_15985 [Candidatus Hydrogenedentes bacterium]|nr:hypothetical protein [Candidatus Hydrogenedentota bacterium]